VFPFSVGGIIMLGLVIASIHKFAAELGADKVVKSHFEKKRLRTWDRTVRTSVELHRRQQELPDLKGRRPQISAPFDARKTTMDTVENTRSTKKLNQISRRRRKPKLLLLREEKDRFDAMRAIQRSTSKFRRWWSLTLSIIAFGILWCIGAVVFWQAEKSAQGMTYFQALYFCYVSLLTIGYGDLSPRTNAGRCFFFVWSLVAVPSITILISRVSRWQSNTLIQCGAIR
jgi:potassium channel subfamily K, other eukaryote